MTALLLPGEPGAQRERILVAGGRSFDDGRLVFTVLDALASPKMPKVEAVISYEDRGAGGWGKAWGVTRGVPPSVLPIQTCMDIGRPTLVLAFAGGRETRDFVRRALGQATTAAPIDALDGHRPARVLVVERCSGERRRWWSGEGGRYDNTKLSIATTGVWCCAVCPKQGFHVLEARL